VIPFSPRALKQIAALYQHYEKIERPDAFRNLILALREASQAIERNPDAGLAAPRPYPTATRRHWGWVKAGRYWVAYRRKPGLIIAAVFYETANIPKRL
jgi:plasmid stabilization system protein ParE